MKYIDPHDNRMGSRVGGGRGEERGVDFIFSVHFLLSESRNF